MTLFKSDFNLASASESYLLLSNEVINEILTISNIKFVLKAFFLLLQLLLQFVYLSCFLIILIFQVIDL